MKEENILRKIVFALVALMGLCACSSSEETENEGGSAGNPNVDLLTEYKWYAHFDNVEVSDDYGWMQSGYTYLYFLPDGTGRDYTWSSSMDSDGDSDKGGDITRFTYEVSGDVVKIYKKGLSSFLKISGRQLVPQEGGDIDYYVTFTAQEITEDDYKYIPKTGKCGDNLSFVCENDTHELTVLGTGDMYDYSGGNYPWKDCYIENVIIDEGVTSVGANAFSGCNITGLDLPNTLKKIGAGAFVGSFIDNVWIPEAVVEIGEYAFSGCSYLKNLRFYGEDPKVEVIGNCAFLGCPIKETTLKLPPHLKKVGTWAFMDAKINNVVLNEELETIGNAVFIGVKGDINIPNSVKSIGGLAFEGSFNKIVIGTGLESLSKAAFASSASSGTMYVNLGIPLDVDGSIITDGHPGNWSLYVPTGCKTAYSKKYPWNEFKAIYEDSSLEPGNGIEEGGDDEPSTSEPSDNEQDEIDAKDSRRGPVSKSFKGSGTSSSPYLISSAADLRLLSDECRAGNTFKGKYFKMTTDITINSNVVNTYTGKPNNDSNFERWIPIGRNGSYRTQGFYGNFDGDGHVISGIYIYRNNESSDIGLFGNVLGSLKNLILKDSYIYAPNTDWSGGIVGHVILPSSGSVEVSNCQNYSVVYGSAGVVGYVGAESGASGTVKIKKCSNYGNVSREKSYCGGIVSYLSVKKSSITDCVNFGTITGHNAGGIVGYDSSSSGEVTNCLNKGEVIGSLHAAGICELAMSSKVFNCVNLSSVDSPDWASSIVSYARNATIMRNYYLTSKCSVGVAYNYNNSSTLSYNNASSDLEMKSSGVLSELNNRKGSGNSSWITGKDGYPMLEWIKE